MKPVKLLLISAITIGMLSAKRQESSSPSALKALEDAKDKSAASQGAEILCKANNDCINTTFCCSSYSCVNPRTCLHGNKTELDVCDYNFECLSRCCVGGVCNHILECYSQCENNSDCIGKAIQGTRVDNPSPNSFSQTSQGCCSTGLCTEAIVCKGNKLLGDFCDNNTECLSELCDISQHKCISNHDKLAKAGVSDIDYDDPSAIETQSQERKLQIKNIVLIACIISFVCLAAIFVKCVQR